MVDIDIDALQAVLSTASHTTLPVNLPPIPSHITPSQALAAVVQAGANLQLAAETLLGSQNRAPQLLALIASDPSIHKTLAAQVRVVHMLNMASIVATLQTDVVNDLSELDPAQKLRAYTSLSDQLTRLTDAKETTTNINMADQVMGMLPPGAKSLFVELIQQANDEQEEIPPYLLIEHSDY